MSVENVKRFVNDVKTNPTLQGALGAKDGRLSTMVEVARANGYDVTLKDVGDYLQLQGHELTEEELGTATGGRNTIWVKGERPRLVVPFVS